MRNHTVSEVTSTAQNGDAMDHGWPLQLNVRHLQNHVKCSRNVLSRKPVAPAQDPDKLAQTRKSQNNNRSLAEGPFGDARLLLIVTYDEPYEHVSVNDNLQGSPAQPRSMASFISSMVATFSVLPARKPERRSHPSFALTA